ncbi:hypothetical protein V6N13_056144 [Hibiscus sabdariffa]
MLLQRAMSLSESSILESGPSRTASVMEASILLLKSGRDLARVDKTSLVTKSARDILGHGSHTTSIAAGNHVGNASFYGLAESTARGGVPSARIAAYKVCSLDECTSETILAGFDDAIADGVDLLTVSLAPGGAYEFYEDTIAIGAFHVAEKGILVVQGAGNSEECSTMGSYKGHVKAINPIKAINPGLVYDNVEGDNIRFLCSIGNGEDNIRTILGTNSSCPKNSRKTLPRDLNYPSLTALVEAGGSFTVNFRRTVTNVGVATSTYNATISSSSKLEVIVIPQVLSFKTLLEKKSYNVTVKGKALAEWSMVSASLTWSDGIHNVRSPIVIHIYKGATRAV